MRALIAFITFILTLIAFLTLALGWWITFTLAFAFVVLAFVHLQLPGLKRVLVQEVVLFVALRTFTRSSLRDMKDAFPWQDAFPRRQRLAR